MHRTETLKLRRLTK